MNAGDTPNNVRYCDAVTFRAEKDEAEQKERVSHPMSANTNSTRFPNNLKGQSNPSLSDEDRELPYDLAKKCPQ